MSTFSHRERDQMRPLLIGESNPYGPAEEFALYPAPYGCAGHRLCFTILGMNDDDYLEFFDRTNLVSGKWNVREARESAKSILSNESNGKLILCGSKVCQAFGLEFKPFNIYRGQKDQLVIPHPSGLCRLWHQAGSIASARASILELCPELAGKVTI